LRFKIDENLPVEAAEDRIRIRRSGDTVA